MFRFHKTLDVITLFHKASSPASLRARSLLTQLSASASASATEDQASDHSAQNEDAKRPEFELEITEEPPTDDQLKSILEYVGAHKAGAVVKGAKNEADAVKLWKQSAENFQRPVIVDWSNGKAVAGAEESEILKMVNALPKD